MTVSKLKILTKSNQSGKFYKEHKLKSCINPEHLTPTPKHIIKMIPC
jgi:hypothetical protein